MYYDSGCFEFIEQLWLILFLHLSDVQLGLELGLSGLSIFFLVKKSVDYGFLLQIL